MLIAYSYTHAHKLFSYLVKPYLEQGAKLPFDARHCTSYQLQGTFMATPPPLMQAATLCFCECGFPSDA